MLQYIFILLLWATFGATCPDNCQCTEYTAECVIVNCESEMETMFDSLTIGGLLCKFHRQILEELQDLTDIILLNDKCGKIPNCRDYVDSEITEEPTKNTPRFSTSTSTPFTTTTNSLVSNTKSFPLANTDYTTNEIPTLEDETTQNLKIEDETSENPISITEDETSENPTSITEDQTSEILFSSIEPTNTVKLNTLLTTNSRAIFKATIRTAASTKTTTTIQTQAATTKTPSTSTKESSLVTVPSLDDDETTIEIEPKEIVQCEQDTPWLLYGIIIGLSLGYILVIIGIIVKVCIKCCEWMKIKWNIMKQNRAQQPNHLRNIQMNVIQMQQDLQEHV